MYFYHLLPKGSNILDGLKSLEWFYKYDKKLFDVYSKKYRYRLCNGWNIYKGRDPESLTLKEVHDGINKFRKSNDGCNQIYFFLFPPYKDLGVQMAELLETKDIYRIDIDDPNTKRYIKSIDYGFEGSNTDNKKLDRRYYENISYDDYFANYNEENSLLFASMNHISICPKNGIIPYNCLTKITRYTKEDNMSYNELDKIKTPEALSKWMSKNIEYYNDNDAIVQSFDELLISKKGDCYDQVEFEKVMFDRMGIKHKELFMIEFKKGSRPTRGYMAHALLYYIKDFKIYWFENAWWIHRGIHGPYNNIFELKNDLFSKWDFEGYGNGCDRLLITTLGFAKNGMDHIEYSMKGANHGITIYKKEDQYKYIKEEVDMDNIKEDKMIDANSIKIIKYPLPDIVPYFTPEEIKDLGAYNDDPGMNYFNAISDDPDTKSWYEFYKATGSPGKDYGKKISKLLEEFHAKGGDSLAQTILEYGWNPYINFSSLLEEKMNANREILMRDYGVTIVDISESNI